MKEWFQGRSVDEQPAGFGWMEILCMAALGVLLAVAAGESRADQLTLDDGKGNTVTLTDEPCLTTVGFFEDMPSNMRVHFKAASTHWNGKDYIACWLLKADGTHFIVDETGDHGVLEGTEFMKKLIGA